MGVLGDAAIKDSLEMETELFLKMLLPCIRMLFSLGGTADRSVSLRTTPSLFLLPSCLLAFSTGWEPGTAVCLLMLLCSGVRIGCLGSATAPVPWCPSCVGPRLEKAPGCSSAWLSHERPGSRAQNHIPAEVWC